MVLGIFLLIDGDFRRFSELTHCVGSSIFLSLNISLLRQDTISVLDAAVGSRFDYQRVMICHLVSMMLVTQDRLIINQRVHGTDTVWTSIVLRS